MIPKPTTRQQAVQNAILAMGEAERWARPGRSFEARNKQVEVYIRIAEGWAAVADVLPRAIRVPVDMEPGATVGEPGGDPVESDSVVLDRQTYDLMRAVIIKAHVGAKAAGGSVRVRNEVIEAFKNQNVTFERPPYTEEWVLRVVHGTVD